MAWTSRRNVCKKTRRPCGAVYHGNVRAQEAFLGADAEAVRRGPLPGVAEQGTRLRDPKARRGRLEERPSAGSEEWVPNRAHDIPTGQETALKAEVIQEKETMRTTTIETCCYEGAQLARKVLCAKRAQAMGTSQRMEEEKRRAN